MNRMIVQLTEDQHFYLFRFFYNNPNILTIEHYVHTQNPLDNLEHYMWEELQEPEHINLKKRYEKYGKLSDNDLRTWVNQEYEEK